MSDNGSSWFSRKRASASRSKESKAKKPRARRSGIIALEPRMMYDGAAHATATHHHHDGAGDHGHMFAAENNLAQTPNVQTPNVQAPPPPAITAVASQPVSGGTVEVQGTGKAGETIKLYADGNTTTVVGTGKVGANGIFDITTSATFADGAHTFTATETGKHHTSAASNPLTVAVDPDAPTITAVVGQPVNGGTVDLQGTGAAGDIVNIYADGNTTTVVGTGTVGANGAFDITTTATFADGVHNFTVKEVDAAGLISTASSALPVDVNPNAPVITSVVGQPVNGGTVDLQGTGEAGETINLYADGGTTIVGTGTVGAGGTFDVTTTATFADGVHTFAAKEIDTAVLTSVASNPLTVAINPNAPTITAVAGQPVNGGTVELQGTGEAGETINIYADGNTTTVVGTGTVGANGTFDITTSATFAEGAHTFTATEANQANLTSAASNPLTVNVDPNAPEITTVETQPVSGGTAELQGTGQAGDIVNIYADGGTTIVGTGTVGANGTFDITTSANFASGAHSFTATETDAAKLTSAASSAANVGANVATWVRNPNEIVFIDQQVPDYQALVAGVNPGTEVVLISANSDGVQQIADFLSSNPDPNLTRIDILGHGQAGELTVGSTNLTDANLAGDAQALAAIGQALAPGGEIALYGCEVAQGAVGQQFIADLAVDAGGLRVAASTQNIGTLQGTNATFENWSLDVASSGPIDTSTPFTTAALASYQGLLAGTTVTGSSITTTLTVDADGDGGISPGDTVTSQITITNTTGTAATGTTLTENPTGLTTVPNSVEITSIGINDSYNLVGNTPITISAASGVLANDIDFNGDALTVSKVNGAAASVGTAIAITGGTLTLYSDGHFIFTPTTGYSGTTSFTYTAHDAAGDSDQVTTVTLNVSAPVWYVDSAAASGGDGSYGHAFQTVDAAWLAAANDSGGGVNNTIFVENAGATYAQTGGTLISLSNGEQLLGDGSSLTEVNGLAVGLSNSNSTFSVSSGNAITLGSGNTISGIDITNTGSGQGIIDDGGTVGTLTMSNIEVTTGSGTGISIHHGGVVDITGTTNSINSTSGTALDIENTNIGSPGVTFESISSGAGANDGIILSNTGTSGGLTVTGDGSTAGSGGTIDGKTGTTGGTTNGIGIYLSNTSDVSIAYMQLDNLSYDGIYGQSVNNFSMDHTVVNGANGSANGEGSVIFGSGQYTGQTVQNGVTGVASITNSTISGGYYDNLDVFNWSGLLNLTLNNDTFGDNNTAHGNHNVYIDPAGIAVINATVTNSHWIGVASGSNFYFDVESTSTTGSNLSFTGNTVADNLGGAGGDGGSGIFEAIASPANGSTSTFDIENNTFSGANGSAVIIGNDETGSPTDTATLNLTFSSNTIGTAATDGSGSADGIGLWVEFNGGTMNATVANNHIYQFATNGIELQGGLATTGNEAGTLNATVIGNTIENPSSSAASRGALQVGVYVEPGPNNGATNSYAFNLTIGGSVASQQNIISVPQAAITAFNADDIELTQDGDTHSPFAINLTAETGTAGTLSTYSGPGNDSGQAVETFLANNNNTPGNTGGYFALAVTGTGYGGGLPTATAPTSGPSFGTPTIVGTDTEGSTLTASPLGTSNTYQWQEAFSNGEWVDISGANLPNFMLTEAQVGATLRVVETSTYSGGLIDTVASAATASVADHLTVTTPFITGTDTVGQILTASTPTVDNSDATVTYQWEENSGSGFVAISGATGQSYRLAAGDVGDTLEVVVTATDPHGGNVSATSGATGTIAAFTAQSFSSVTLGTLPGNDAVTITGKFTVNAQSEQLIVNPTYTGSITGSNFTTVTANGTVPLDTLTLGGEIFNDNGNGILDAGESGIAGISVSVFAQGGSTALETTTTNAFGIYDFTGLAAGNYFVEINASNFTGGGALANYSNSSPIRDTTPNDYAGGKNYGLALSGGVIDTNAITIAYDAPHPSGAGVDTTQTLSIGMIADPVIGAAGNTVQFYQSQGSTGTPLDSAITVTDAVDIASATVTITGGYQSGDTLSFGTGNTESFGDGSTITATQSGGVLTLTTTSGNATAADYQTALESVKYDFTGDPTVAGADPTRTIAWSVTDANNAASKTGSSTTLDVYASPIVTVGAYTPPTVTAASGAVVADPSLGVTDYNGTTIVGATVVISAGAQAGDTLTIGGLTSGTITDAGGTINYSFAGSTLTLTSTGTNTVADYKAALDQVKFDATNPHNGTRTLTWQVNDNAGGHVNDSVAVTTTVNASFGPQITSVVGQPVNGGTVQLDGTGVTVGDTINLYADGNIAVIVGTGTVGAGGTFDITTTKTYADGIHDFTAAETNSSNPTIPLAPEFAVEVESLAPTGLTQVGTPTNGGSIEITGSTTDATGDTIKLYATDNGVTTQIGTGLVQAGGSFDITATGPFLDGTYSVTATDTSVDGSTTSAKSTAVNAVVGVTAPTGLTQVGTPTNGGSIEITGSTTDATGDTIKLYATDNGVTTQIGTGLVQAGGSFDITATGPFLDGTYSVTATDTSVDGSLTSAKSTAVNAVVGVTAPTGLTQVGTPTNGGSIEITGSTTDATGDTIKLYATDNGVTTQIGTGLVQAGGSFDITATGPFLDGTYSVTATDTSVDGSLTSAKSTAVNAVVGVTAPTGLTQVGTPTNGGSIEITGSTTDATGDTIKLYATDNGVTTQIGTGLVQAGGSFDITATGPFLDGTYSVTATDTSVDGSLTSAKSTAVNAVVGVTAPTGLTQQGSPTNGGSIEITGSTTDATGDTIKLYATDNGVTTQIGTGLVQAGGSFDITATGPFLDGTYSVTATDTSVDGSLTSAKSTAVNAVVGVTAPTGLTQVGTPTNGGSIEITGSTTDATGDTIKLYATDNGVTTQIGTGLVQAGGSFDITATGPFLDGTYSVTATDTSVDGSLTSAKSTAVNAVVGVTAPTGLTQVGTPTNGGSIEITGSTTDATGDTIKLYATDNGVTTQIGTGLVQAGGSFDITATGPFLDGTYSVTATDTSVDGSLTSAKSTAVNAVVGVTAPTGLTQVGTPTNGGSIEITGSTTDATGDTIKLYATDNGVTTQIGTGLVQAGGSFDITATGPFLDGTYSVTATDTSVDGSLTSAKSTAVNAVVGVTAPTGLTQVGTPTNGGSIEITGSTTDATGDTIKLYATDNGVTTQIGTGLVQAGGSFDITATGPFLDGTYSVTATDTSVDGSLTSAKSTAVNAVVGVTAPTGLTQVGTPTNGGSIEITGSTTDATGDTIKLYATDNGVTTQIGTGLVQAGGSFDITATGPFPDGTYSVTATDTSVDGSLTSAKSTAATAVVSAVAPTGLAQQGSATNGGPIAITGTGDAVGDQITLYQNGVAVGTGTVGAGDKFDITTTKTFPDGTYSLTATDTSVDGTQTSPMSSPVTAMVEPVAPVITTLVGQQPVNGQTVELQGAGQAGDIVNLYADGGTTIVGTGTVDGTGHFDITTTATFPDGVHTFTATETDTAHLTSTASTPAFTVDVNPSAPTGLAVVGQPVNGQTVTVTGSGEAGDTVTLYNGATIVGTGVVGAGGTFSVTTTSALHDGAYSFMATETDAANLTSAASKGLTVDVNPSAPTITTLVEVVIGGRVDLQGTGEAGETVNLYADGNTTTVVGSGKVDGSGHFDITTTANFSTGLHTFTATETDVAGLTSTPSNTAFTVNVDLFSPQRVFTDNSTSPSLPNITLASLVGDVPRGALLPSGDGFGIGTGGGFSFNVVHVDPVLTTASDANVQINLALAALEAPLGGDVVYVEARQADGKPLPDWLKFNPATGTFAGIPPDNAVASLAPDLSSDNNIVTGTLKQDFNDGSGRHAAGTSSITIEVLARDSKGNVAVTVFTIDLQPQKAGQHGWNMQPFGVERHASLETLSPELAAIEAAVRDVTRPVEPFDVHGMAVGHGDAISVGAHETVPAGRVGLTEQMASIGWRSMAAQRNALLASLQRGR